MEQHTKYLTQALELAALRQGFCAPNPAVGAVVVKNNRVLATGYHRACGEPHAEVDALNQLKPGEAKGGSLYVTLEPCCHWGKTPPCTDKIIASGITAVYYGYADPNPLVGGNGAQQLRGAGISCEQLPISAIDEFYRSYAHWRQTQTPWVTAKLALSLDGKIAGCFGKPVAITGNELQHYTHQWRKRSDAILTTVETVLNDDPQLNVRLEQQNLAKPIYILDSQLKFPLTAKLMTTAAKITLFHRLDIAPENRQRLQQQGITCIAVPPTVGGLDLAAVMRHIGAAGVHDLWVEAGGRCFTSLISQQLAHRALLYVSLKFLGKSAQAVMDEPALDFFAKAKKIQWQGFGNDGVCEMEFSSLSAAEFAAGAKLHPVSIAKEREDAMFA